MFNQKTTFSVGFHLRSNTNIIVNFFQKVLVQNPCLSGNGMLPVLWYLGFRVVKVLSFKVSCLTKKHFDLGFRGVFFPSISM